MTGYDGDRRYRSGMTGYDGDRRCRSGMTGYDGDRGNSMTAIEGIEAV